MNALQMELSIYMSHNLCKIDKNMEQQLQQYHRMQLMG